MRGTGRLAWREPTREGPLACHCGRSLGRLGLSRFLAVCPRTTGPAVVVVVQAGPSAHPPPCSMAPRAPLALVMAGSRYACPTSLHDRWRALRVGRWA